MITDSAVASGWLYRWRIWFLAHGSAGAVILAIAGIADAVSPGGNGVASAVYLIVSFVLLTVLAKLYFIPFVVHGRLPSGRSLGEVRAVREQRHREREARRHHVAKHRK